MTKVKSYFKYFVYRHIRLDKNEPFYVGIGTCSKWGFCHRAFSTKRNIIWHRITGKSKFTVDIFFETDNYQEAIEKEKEFIKIYGRLDLKTGTLCNLTDGGEGKTNILTTETTRAKFRARQLGNKLPQSTRENMSSAQKIRYIANPISPKAITIFQYSLDGLFIKKWHSPTHASKELGFSSAKIFNALKKENKYAQGSFWFTEFKGLQIVPNSNYIRHSPVVKMDLYGNELKVYKTILEASLDVCGNRTGLNFIKPVCEGKKELYKNFKWKYYA